MTQRGVIEMPQQQQISSPDICDLIVPPPPPPPQSRDEQYSTPPPPVEFCECDGSQTTHRNILVDKASCLQDFRSRVIMIGGGGGSSKKSNVAQQQDQATSSSS